MRYSSSLLIILLLGSTLVSCQKKGQTEPLPVDPPKEIPDPTSPNIPIQGDFRVLTYNILHGVGTDNILNLDRIADILKNSGASIISLNEVDRHYSSRSAFMDQIAYLADKLKMNYVYQPTTTLEPTAESGNKPREHGHAILTKYSILESEKKVFSQSDDNKRGILRTKLNINGKNTQVFISHWALTEQARYVQLKESMEFMNDYPGSSILLGDLNAIPDEHNIIALKSRLIDATNDQVYSFNSVNPTKKIDYIFSTRDFEVKNGQIIQSQASDHFPVFADLKFKEINNSLLYPNFPESFEISDGQFINYEGGIREKSFPSGIWHLSQTAIVNTRLFYDDKPVSGSDALRMRQNLDTATYIQMNFNVPNGASKVSVWYSVYFKDVGSTWCLEQSNDSGKTWTKVGQDISDAQMVKKKVEFSLNVDGNVRFRIKKYGRGTGTTGRLNFDDFAIYKKN